MIKTFVNDVWYETTRFLLDILLNIVGVVWKIFVIGIQVVFWGGIVYLVAAFAINEPFFFTLFSLFLTLWIIFV